MGYSRVRQCLSSKDDKDVHVMLEYASRLHELGGCLCAILQAQLKLMRLSLAGACLGNTAKALLTVCQPMRQMLGSVLWVGEGNSRMMWTNWIMNMSL